MFKACERFISTSCYIYGNKFGSRSSEISTLPSQLYSRGNIFNDKYKTDTTRALYHYARYSERTSVSGPDSWKQKLNSQ